MSLPEAVIFDHDGVLVDSEPIALGVWRSILDEHAVEYRTHEIEAMVGLTDAASHASMAGRPGMPGFEEFIVEFEQRRDARFVEKLRPFPDAAEAVPALAFEGIPLGVATNATRKLLELSMSLTGLGRYFSASAARTDVAEGKPAPDVYLAVAAALGIAPAACIAVEDSATGAAAARSAGMRVVTVARTGSPPPGFASVPAIDAELLLTWMGRR